MTVNTSVVGATYSGPALDYRSCLNLLLALPQQSILLPYLNRKLLADGLDPHGCRLLRFDGVLKLFILEFLDNDLLNIPLEIHKAITAREVLCLD